MFKTSEETAVISRRGDFQDPLQRQSGSKLAWIMGNSVLLVGIVGALVLGAGGMASPVIAAEQDPDLQALEQAVAQSPSAASVASLASGYLNRKQPGLAQAVLDQHPNEDSAELGLVRARAAFDQGRTEEARSLAATALYACEAAPPQQACNHATYSKLVRQTAILDAMSAAGVEDAAKNPEGARAALATVVREVRLQPSY